MTSELTPRRHRWLVVGVLAFLLLPQAAFAKSGLTCRTLPHLMFAYLEHHVVYHSLTPQLKQRTLDSYLRHVDPSRTLLLKKEAADLETTLMPLFDRMQQGDCQLLFNTQQELVEHYRKMEAYIRAFVDRPNYKIDEKATLVLDPTKRGFPKTDTDRDALYRAYTHFQMSNYISSGTSMQEAKDHLVHRYELLTKDAGEQTADDIYATFLDSFATALDPHSSYLSADQLEDFKIFMGLSLEGIGAELSSRDGYVTVERLVPGGAAAREGELRPKDKIVTVTEADGKPVNVIDMQLRDVVRMIRGKKGTPVKLTVLRTKGKKVVRLNITIIRDKINLKDEAASVHFENVKSHGKTLKLAILDLPSFYGDTGSGKRKSLKDVDKLLHQVVAAKADGLVLDLSRNGGGLLDQAVGISGLFIHKGAVVGVRDARDNKQVLQDPDPDTVYAGPMVILVSRVSASASEIVTGAMKDYHRAVIVGDAHTFGKGTVQTMVNLPQGLGAIKVTVAMFFRPGGQSTQDKGVKSDIEIPSLTNLDDIGETSEPYALPAQSIAPFLSTTADDPRPDKHWIPVTPKLVAALAKRSARRVAHSKAFRKIEKSLADSKKKDGVVELADMQETDEHDKKSEAQKPKTDEDSPQMREAVKILTDMIALEH